ncbi:HERC2, partial [Symbiodinium sp. CCMP2456]
MHLSIFEGNRREGDIARISGLAKATSLNGQICYIRSPKGAERYDVQLVDGSMKAVKAENLTVLPTAGSNVATSTAVEGMLVQRGPCWSWANQDGGLGCVGHVLKSDSETGWVRVRWNSGKTNRYRAGAEGKHDLCSADPFEHERACFQALQKGKGAIRACHLQCTFAYPLGVEAAHVSFFDIRDEVCLAVGGNRHGQRVQVGGRQAVAIGVAPLSDSSGDVHLYYHVDGAEGAGVFEDSDERRIKPLHRQKVREASHLPSKDNMTMLKLAKDVTPTFRYIRAANSLLAASLDLFDIRDEICVLVGGYKHGQVILAGGISGLVIGVLLYEGLPMLFLHMDGLPGAGTFNELAEMKFRVVGSRVVEETPADFLDEPEPSPEVLALAARLQCDFSYPCGTFSPHLDSFDIRDEVCAAVGGFLHGQVVECEDLARVHKELFEKHGDIPKLYRGTVIGVKLNSQSVPELMFHQDGCAGAGTYPKYHLFRKQLKVVGQKLLEPVSVPPDPSFRQPGSSTPAWEPWDSLLQDFLRSMQVRFAQESESSTYLDPDFEYDYTFRYMQKNLVPGLFDIRDEVCIAVGGFKHGDVLSHPGGTAVVIGVRPDKRGKPQLWMHDTSERGAFILGDGEQQLLRHCASVVGKRKLQEFQDPEPQTFSADFVQGLQCTFRYPVGRKKVRPAYFDIRDHVCLEVGGFKHGEKLFYDDMTLVVVGVMLVKGKPTMFFQLLEPCRHRGAGTLRRIDVEKAYMRFIGMELLQEAASEDFDMDEASESDDSSSGSAAAATHNNANVPATTPASETRPNEPEMSGCAVLLQLSRCGAKVKEALLSSADLAECRQDVLDAGCEITPEWANGAVLLAPLTEEKATEAGLKLRAHHVVAFEGDTDRVRAALQGLPCKWRPRINGPSKLEQAAEDRPRRAEGDAGPSQSSGRNQ